MENFQLFIRIGGFWNTDVQLSPHVQPKFTHRKTAAVAYRAHRDPQFCWVTYSQNTPKSHSVLFACPETCSEHSQDVIVLDKESSPHQIALWQKIPCSLLKKKNLIILADWTSFAQIIYRCNPGTAEGTGNFAISVFGCVHATWKEPSPEEWSAQHLALVFYPWLPHTCPGVAGESAALQRCFRQPGRSAERNVPAGSAAVLAISPSARPALKAALEQALISL